MPFAVVAQIMLLVYHQATTWLNLHPFNGARNYSRQEKLAEAGLNAVLMSIAPAGFLLDAHGMMAFGVGYYFYGRW